MAAPGAAAAAHSKPKEDLKCSACGEEGGEFSNRQRNKAIMGEPARCKQCIDKSIRASVEEHSSPEKERLYFSDGESVSGGSSSSSSGDKENELTLDDDNDNHDVSLNALKEQILGRKLITPEDDAPIEQDTDMKLPAIKNAAHLRKELSCAICHEPFFQPLSLSCGHSYCQACLKWWLGHSKQPEGAEHGTCPTCRCDLVSSGDSLGINTALRAAVMALYGEEIEKRDQAEKLAKVKATAGEHGGAHSRGYEVLSDMASQDWERLMGDETEGFLFARRSIVLDEQDARMQLALAVDYRPGVPPPTLVDNRVLQVSLTLLTMEEDEVEDGGFPLILKDEDDENLIVREGGIETVKASIVGRSGARVQEGIEQDGAICFRIPLGAELIGSVPTCVRFRHERTGAEYEIRVSREQCTHAGEGASADSGRTSFIVGGVDNEDEGPDEYEDDGFLVMNDEEEEEESASESEGGNEEDLCCICREHGDLIVCDGGDHLEGCGRSFHIHCVERDEVPPGDWICENCASAIELDVGIEGHEFVGEHGEAPNQVSRKRVLEDSSGDESDASLEVVAAPAGKKKRARILDSDSDDD